MRQNTATGLAAGAIGGLAMAAAFPPLSAPWLAPIAVAAFFASTRSSSVRGSATSGYLFGLTFFATSLWWVWQSIGPGAWVALVLVQGLWMALLGAGTALVRTLRWWPVWASALWASVETLRSLAPLGGLPWGRLGYTVVDTPWAVTLAMFGTVGAGWAVAFAGALLASTIEDVANATRSGRPGRSATTWRTLGRSLAAIAALVTLGVIETAHLGTVANTSTAKIAVIQGQVPGDGTQVVANHREITQTLAGQTRELLQTVDLAHSPLDFVLWPENSTAVDPETDSWARDTFQSTARTAHSPLLAGSIADGPTSGTAFNQGVVWSEAGPQERYTKQHLVPFGEYVPIRTLAGRLSSRVADIQRDMVPGEAPRPLRIADLTLANAICFDVAYDAVIREQVSQGANLVAVQTSNAMFLRTAQQEQQWMITRARAIEVGRSVVVSSMNGISGVVAPDGSVIERLPSARSGGVVATVPLRNHLTPAVRIGAGPQWAALFIALGALAAAVGMNLYGRREAQPSAQDPETRSSPVMSPAETDTERQPL